MTCYAVHSVAFAGSITENYNGSIAPSTVGNNTYNAAIGNDKNSVGSIASLTDPGNASETALGNDEAGNFAPSTGVAKTRTSKGGWESGVFRFNNC